MQVCIFLARIGALSALLCVAVHAGEVYKFSPLKGKPYSAEIISVDPIKITVLREGQEVTERFSDFSPGDIEHFREWMRENRTIYDWPGEHGLNYDGSTSEALPAVELPILWRAQVGAGDAAVAIGFERALTTGVSDGEFVVTAFNLEKGEQAWKKSRSLSGGELASASATPAIDHLGKHAITVAPDGRYDGWELQGGEPVWADQISTKYPDASRPAGGRYGSPVVNGTGLYVEVGAPAYSLVRLMASRGSENWRIGKYPSLGITPIVSGSAERRLIVCRNAFGIVARDIEAGTRNWQLELKPGGHVSPLPLPGDRYFVTTPDSLHPVESGTSQGGGRLGKQAAPQPLSEASFSQGGDLRVQ